MDETVNPSEQALSCARCDKQLSNVFDGAINQPSRGASFTSHGHYGSSFDPMSASVFLELNICDDCLTLLSNQKQVLLGNVPRKVAPEPTYTVWDPEEFYDY